VLETGNGGSGKKESSESGQNDPDYDLNRSVCASRIASQAPSGVRGAKNWEAIAKKTNRGV